ncbi:MAG: acyltransferase [Calditrichaeota bacterium]|nr:MAG: acyltransferase [Calditrichota bacterium]
MLNFLPAPILGAASLLFISVNTIFWSIILYVFIFFKLISPLKSIRLFFARVATVCARFWVECNSFIFRVTQKMEWDIEGLENLDRKKSYLLVSNHRSWTDIFVLQQVFKREIPFLKFFLKKELIWVPFLGFAWWGLDFPFMKRYSREKLRKHPELRGKDIQTTRDKCKKFKDTPVSVINFLEGTRFNFEKKEKQNSPFIHLLKPKAGGIALVLSSMGDYLSNILDITIVYPGNQPPHKFWDLLKGNIPNVTVRVNALPVPQKVVGKNYSEDTPFRQGFQQWVNDLWQKKDKQIDSIITRYRQSDKS